MKITRITEENKTYFYHLMPEEFWNRSDMVFGAICEDTACGVLAVDEIEDTILSISFLFVEEEFRRRGIASALLQELHTQASQVGYDLSICQFMHNEDTADLKNCLLHGVFDEDELSSSIYRFKFKDLSEKLLGRENSAENVLALSKASRIKWNELITYLNNKSNDEGIVPDLKGISSYEKDASFLLIDKGNVKGCILLEKQGDDYILPYFCIFEGVAPIQMMVLFQESYRVLKEQCKSDTAIYVNALTETAKKLVLYMTEEKAELIGEAVTMYYTY